MNPLRVPRPPVRGPLTRRARRSVCLRPDWLEARDCPATNLVANPSVETAATAARPAGWQPNAYGSNSPTFSYPATGLDGQRSVRVDMASHSSGDAKWYFDDVPVSPGQKYTFSDLYTSNVTTSATVRYRMANGSYQYIGYYPTGPAATPTRFTFDFTPPSGAVSATVFHLIRTRGFLVTDAFSLAAAGTNPPPDTTAPSVSVTAPAANATVSGTITLAATAADNVGVAGVRFLIDGVPFGIEDTAAPYQASLNTTTLANGTHTVRAVARDAAGNSTTSAAVTFTVANTTTPPPDTTAPAVSVTAPAANATVSGTISLAAQASDNVGVAGVRFLVDGAAFGSEDTAAPYQVALDTATLANGTHTVAAVARDAAGNLATSAAVTFTVSNTTPPPASNLVQNPSLETLGTNGDPAGWTRSTWGTNTTAFALVPGFDGARAARVEMTAYASGDAKWFFNDVTVSANTTYTFSDAYRSNRESKLVARYRLSDGSFSYAWVASLPASANWTTASYQVTVPAGVAAMTMFHLIEGVGWLETDKFSLAPPAAPPPPGPGRGMITLAFDDGWVSQLQNAVPVLQQASLPASFFIITRANQGGGAFELVQNRSLEAAATVGGPADWGQWRTGTNSAAFTHATTGSDGTRSARIDVSSHTSGDAAWFFQDVQVTPGTQYAVSHQFNATVPTSVLVRFTRHDGSLTFVDMGTLPATGGSWQTQQFTVTAPANADAMTVLHRITGVGALATDNYSVKPVNPFSNPSYMTPAQVQSLRAAGFEVGAHTMTHADLTALSPAGARAEIDGSRADLAALGITPTTFVYPYGAYNTAVRQLVADEGFVGARTVNPGYNTGSTDRLLLMHQEVDQPTTLADVQGWIDTATRNQSWLILTFHEVSDSGGFYRTTPETFRQIANLVASSSLTPVTMADGVARLAAA